MNHHRLGPRPRAYWAARAAYQAANAVHFAGVGAIQAARRQPPAARTGALSNAAQAAGTARQSLRMARRPAG